MIASVVCAWVRDHRIAIATYDVAYVRQFV
jgi:hypothetical protein